MGLVVAAFVISLGVALVRRSESPLGVVGSCFFLVAGAVTLLGFVVSRGPQEMKLTRCRDAHLDDEPAEMLQHGDWRFGVGMVGLLLLGGWCLALGIVGAIQETWGWLLLVALPVIYLLAVPVFVAFRLYRRSVTWLTPTRIVNEQFGVCAEIDLVDVDEVRPWSEEVHLDPVDPSCVRYRNRVPRPWRVKVKADEFLIPSDGIEGGAYEFAAELRRRVDAAKARASGEPESRLKRWLRGW